MGKPDHQKIITDYKAAYKRANGTDISVEYGRGWFRIAAQGAVGTRHRRAEVEKFTSVLLARSRTALGWMSDESQSQGSPE